MAQLFISGASGLLGKEFVRLLTLNNHRVVAHFFSSQITAGENLHWIQGDFSTLSGLRSFLSANWQHLCGCDYFIHCYGPLSYCHSLEAMKTEDMTMDFLGNVITGFEITRFLMSYAKVQSILYFGFEETGIIKPYSHVLPYAMAKNSLLLLIKSFAVNYPHVRFNMVSPVTMSGARYARPNTKTIEPAIVAEESLKVLFDKKTTAGNIFIDQTTEK